MNRLVLARKTSLMEAPVILDGVRIDAVVGADIPPGAAEVNSLPHRHLSVLLSEPWTTADVVVREQDTRESLPLLLSMGIPSRRVQIWQGHALVPMDTWRGFPSIATRGLTELQNIHSGRRAFIIGNGPSLRLADLDRLRGEITYASNKIYLAYDETDWRPTYYTVCDYLVAQNNAEAINQLACKKLFPRTLQKHGCNGDSVTWYEERFENKFFDAWPEEVRDRADFLFSQNAIHGLQGGYTVIYHQLQLAFFMGIREAYILGVDFHFDVPKTTAEDGRFTSDVYRKALSSSGEVNHFHKDYRKAGEKWSIPRLDLQSHAFRSAGQAFARAGGRLLNASRRSALASLDRIDFDEAIS